MNRVWIFAACLAVASFATPAGAADNMVANGDFAKWSGNSPEKWALSNNKQTVSQDTTDKDTALKVELVQDGGSNYGEIRQTVKVKRNTLYKFTGMIKATNGAVAFFQLKPRSGRKELDRISLPFNTGTSWETMTKDIDTGNADDVQVLCRYRQKAGFVGTTIWYTAVTLEEIGDSPDKATADAKVEQVKKLQRVPGLANDLGERQLKVASAGRDVYVTPAGAGTKDGTSWDNAMPGAGEALQAAWNLAGPGNTVYVGSGEYRDAAITASAGGIDPAAPITLQGVDTGTGLPKFVSGWSKEKPDSGKIVFRVNPNVGYVTVSDLQVRNYMVAVVLDGLDVGIRIANIDARDVREGFILNGGATAEAPYIGTEDVVITDCKVIKYTKRGVRIRDGVSMTRIINVDTDAGGKEYAVEPFHMGFSVQGGGIPGVYDHDIVFINCTARNNYHNAGGNQGKYWNADGFCAERNSYNLAYIGCKAFDNTDGGWDLKARNPVLVDCVSLRNKRNYRFWSKPGPALLTNCVAGYAIKRGGSGNTNGIHVTKGAYVLADHCTFVRNGTGVDIDSAYNGAAPTFSEVRKSIFVDETKPFDLEEAGKLRVVDCVVNAKPAEAATGVAEVGTTYADPKLNGPRAAWEGGDNAFDSTVFVDQGYHYTQP